MSRRFPTSRRPALESLETRCNPAALDPFAGAFMDAAPEAPAQVDFYLNLKSIDSEPPGSSAGSGLPNVQVRDLELNQTTNVLAEPVSLNAFAGQTVRILVEAADASTASLDAGGKTIYVGSENGGVWKSMGASAIEPGAAYTFTIDPRTTGFSTGGAVDILIANTGGDRIAPSGTLYVATEVGVWRSELESLIDDLARDVASQDATGYQTGYIGWVKISPD